MSDYTRGKMDVKHHKETFKNVMSVSVTVSLITSIIVLYLVLIFCGVTDWFMGLVASTAVGFICGISLKQGVGYWTFLVLFNVLSLIVGSAFHFLL